MCTYSSAFLKQMLIVLLVVAGCDDTPLARTSDAADATATKDAGPPADVSPANERPTKKPDGAAQEPDCAATGGASCFYVATDGDDKAAGTIAAPFKTIQFAVEKAKPGDYVYARGGTYGKDNAAVGMMRRLPKSAFPPPCAAGQVEADGYCQVKELAFASIKDWHGYPLPGHSGYDVSAGEPTRPITLRNFPGELPVLDMATLGRGAAIEAALIMSQKRAIAIRRSHWVIRGFEIIGGSIDLSGNIKDITIEHCHVHDLILDGGDNPGLIRLNRGPEKVRILNNRLHGIYDHETPTKWDKDAEDVQHFGAVTTLSGETYGGTDDTGAIDIHHNVIFNVPQAFFFKNAAKGPIDIVGNHIYDSDRLSSNVSANVRFAGNVVHGVRTGFWRQGYGTTEKGTKDPTVLAIDGHNLKIEYNTIVGLKDTLVGSHYGNGHLFQYNVIFGLPGTAASANYDSASFIKVKESASAAKSRLHSWSSDKNCFIVPSAGFQLVARYPSSGPVEHFDLTKGRATFGLDLNSTVVISTDETSVFSSPKTGDYTLLKSVGCGSVGHAALP